jgi:hypothetical protein
MIDGRDDCDAEGTTAMRRTWPSLIPATFDDSVA